MPVVTKHKARLRIEQRADGKWYVVGVPDPSCPETSGFATRAEADEERRGMQRFLDANPEF